MSEESIFGNATTAAEPEVVQNPATSAPAIPPEVAEFVGEGKKYKTLEDALKSIPHAQSHIQKLEEKAKELEEKANQTIASEELLEEIRKLGTKPQETSTKAIPETKETSTIDITAEVERVLQRQKAVEKAEANRLKVISEFQSKFGDESETKYLRIAQENNMSVDALNRLSLVSPDAVLALAGLKKTDASYVAKPTSSVNTQNNFGARDQEVSARVPPGASTKDLTQAWRNAGIKVQQQNKG